MSLCCFTGKEARGDKVVLGGLVDACSEVLWEAEEIAGDVWVWTVQADLQMVESDELGFNIAYCGLRKLLVFRPQRWRTPRRLFA